MSEDKDFERFLSRTQGNAHTVRMIVDGFLLPAGMPAGEAEKAAHKIVDELNEFKSALGKHSVTVDTDGSQEQKALVEQTLEKAADQAGAVWLALRIRSDLERRR